MTAKEFVQGKFPKAKAERHTKGRIVGLTESYWLIRIGNNYMWFAEGKTESNAWVNAKKKIKEIEESGWENDETRS